jgi:predicted esterase
MTKRRFPAPLISVATGFLCAKSSRMALICLLLLGGPFGLANAAAPAPSQAHVYLIRGVFNVFSLGMDEIAQKLTAQGIPATVHNHLAWATVAADAEQEYKSGRAPLIILVGHSQGATILPNIIQILEENRVPVALAIGLDSVFPTDISGHVGRYINYYIGNGVGTQVAAAKDFHGALENVDVENIPGMGHVMIDKNETMQQKVIADIDRLVLNLRPSHALGRRR